MVIIEACDKEELFSVSYSSGGVAHPRPEFRAPGSHFVGALKIRDSHPSKTREGRGTSRWIPAFGIPTQASLVWGTPDERSAPRPDIRSVRFSAGL